jgi:hypothetical protein
MAQLIEGGRKAVEHGAAAARRLCVTSCSTGLASQETSTIGSRPMGMRGLSHCAHPLVYELRLDRCVQGSFYRRSHAQGSCLSGLEQRRGQRYPEVVAESSQLRLFVVLQNPQLLRSFGANRAEGTAKREAQHCAQVRAEVQSHHCSSSGSGFPLQLLRWDRAG